MLGTALLKALSILCRHETSFRMSSDMLQALPHGKGLEVVELRGVLDLTKAGMCQLHAAIASKQSQKANQKLD